MSSFPSSTHSDSALGDALCAGGGEGWRRDYPPACLLDADRLHSLAGLHCLPLALHCLPLSQKRRGDNLSSRSTTIKRTALTPCTALTLSTKGHGR
ncbi:hypothetical protein GOP47_0021523 [Adiantum capillus-veneris]|uniref:Uncharacterized protein n=1 Tax=Adiantum capillus-veneris TaxID=13818 RepID=A0A9D4U7L9_ADICA|nr:hypothetical protein GOP47_0021523 [Adiantum capillus-veneris]